MSNKVLYSMDITDETIKFASSIDSALEQAENELICVNETIESVNQLKPNCDKIDYALAASSGALCGLIDVFLVGKPKESPFGNITDKWFENRVRDFARLCGWSGEEGSTASATRFLEKKFKIPYDQNGIGDIAKGLLDLTPSNHHFKSLGHNPTIMGLFFSVLDQFCNTSHFVSENEFIVLSNVGNELYLKGKDVPSKIFCGFANWLGHLISDGSGSSGSKTRGMGIPSPIWSWSNDIIAIKKILGIGTTEFDVAYNEMALNIYSQGYDLRFQAAQLIPVFINELIVRLTYSIRRMVQYFSTTCKENRSFKLLWKRCEPFTNPTVKRILTVAHGTFCLIDIGDATIRGFVSGGGTFKPSEFFLRLNIPGLGRFAVSLYGEASTMLKINEAERSALYATKKRLFLNDYINGLKELSNIYDDKMLLSFVHDLRDSYAYITAFNKTGELAKLRKVPEDKILVSKENIDKYFKVKGNDGI